MNPDVALSLRGISKRFGPVRAADGVSLDVRIGEIHALVGENGAGKSTLAAIAYGAIEPDSGTVQARGPVGLVHQHFQLVGRLRVWENVLLGREPRRGWRIDVGAAREQVATLAAEHGLSVDPDALVEDLPIGVQQRVELLRELSRRPRILLLDEPTAVLAPTEIASFFSAINAFAGTGIAVLIVTHKLQEVIDFTERVTVMRAGRVVAAYKTAETTTAEIARAMIGGQTFAIVERGATPRKNVPLTSIVAEAPRLEVRDFSAGTGSGSLADASFAVESAEIVGIAGIEGNGQTALADALAGMIPFRGTLLVDGVPVSPHARPRERLDRGMRFIPEDRRDEALVLAWPIEANVALGRHRTPPVRRGAVLDRGATLAAAQEVIEGFDVRPPDPQALVNYLSGGNQQKIVVGRALTAHPRVVIACQPTRGIDVGAATLVHSRLMEARNGGVAVLLISSELDEIFELADRVLVMHGGRIAGTFERAWLDRDRIGALMAGA